MGHKILIVEDDDSTRRFIEKGFDEAGYIVDCADNGRDGLFLGSEGAYDTIVLDRTLPGMEGMAVLAALRAAGITTPVIILSAISEVDERIKGLEAGADDYLAKPFAFAELYARVKLLVRKGTGTSAETELVCEDLCLNLLSRKAERRGRAIELQPREFRLLEYLMRHADEVVTRTMLLEGVWDYHFDPGTNVIDVHISRLRRKLELDDGQQLLHTVRGAGYRLGAA